MTNLSNLRNALQHFDTNLLIHTQLGLTDTLIDYGIMHHIKQNLGYPPYNIQRTDDYKYEIEMALAGFDKKDLEIKFEDGCLTVKSVKDKDKGATDDYTIYKGISQRNFTRKFTLADEVVVNGAKLENGMLTIELERIVPEEKKAKTIDIA